jgi:hypothetical protein
MIERSITTNYFIARETCTKGCICNKEKSIYIISNVLWEFNQTKLLNARKNLNEAEKDEIIKSQLFHSLKNQINKVGGVIQCSSQRIPLIYNEIFVDPSNDSKSVFELCEDCWVLYNHHKGKISIFIFNS